METVGLLTLIIEYEIPPSKIVDAIVRRDLRPVVDGDELSLDAISFDRTDVHNLFWAYELKCKSNEFKDEASRRLQRQDAIVAGVISAVIASGVVGTAGQVWNRAGDSRQRERSNALDRVRFGLQGRLWPRPRFEWPVDPPHDRFNFAKSGGYVFCITEARRNVGGFRLLAVADGMVRFQHAVVGGTRDFVLRHDEDCVTRYQTDADDADFLVTDQQVVRAGSTLIAFPDSVTLREIQLITYVRQADNEWWATDPPIGDPSSRR